MYDEKKNENKKFVQELFCWEGDVVRTSNTCVFVTFSIYLGGEDVRHLLAQVQFANVIADMHLIAQCP